MARKFNRRKSKQSEAPLLTLGIQTLTTGAGLWVASLILGSNVLLAGAAGMLKMPALIALAIGALLLAAHLLTRKNRPIEVPGLRPVEEGAIAGAASNPDQASPDWSEQTPPPPKESQWSKAVFSAIEWRRFKAVCEALFAQAGFETRSQSHGADGGVDIWLHSKHATGPVSVVQCKHWRGKAVGVKELREFFGVMASHGLKRGTYATTSTYTADALDFAKANGISAMDGATLLKLIATQRTPEQQAALLDVAYEGEYWKPTCASCGVKMTERTPRSGGAAFWGCMNFPRCKSRLPMKLA